MANLKIKKNIPLSQHTTFKIGGRAKYFFEAKINKEIIEAIAFAKENKVPFSVIGGGSNLLVSDNGYKGLVIKIKNSEVKIQDSGTEAEILCGAGLPLAKLVQISLEKSLTDFEWAAGIPGTIGGAVYGNAGAFGKSIADEVKVVEVLEMRGQKNKIKNFENKGCSFGYRESIFKKRKNLIILSSLFRLKKGSKEKIKKQINKNLKYKKETQPLEFPSAGSIFKNFQGEINNQKLINEFPELQNFNEKRLISAAYLIEKCGLKGKRIGNVKISEKHANFIVNLGQGRASDVKKLINLAKRKIKEKFGIKLQEEIQYLGF